MLYGAGQLVLISKGLSSEVIGGSPFGVNFALPGLIASFELTFNDQLAEAKALVGGKRQIVAAAITESIATLSLTFEYMDWNTLQMAFDEVSAKTSSVKLPITSTVKLDNSGNYSGAIPGVTGTLGVDYFVYRATRTGTVDRSYSPNITVTANSIAGGEPYEVIQVIGYQTVTDVASIGDTTEFASFGKLIFSGILAGTEVNSNGIQIVVPELSRVSTPQLSVTGDKQTMKVDFRASVPTGGRKAFQLYNLSNPQSYYIGA